MRWILLALAVLAGCHNWQPVPDRDMTYMVCYRMPDGKAGFITTHAPTSDSAMAEVVNIYRYDVQLALNLDRLHEAARKGEKWGMTW